MDLLDMLGYEMLGLTFDGSAPLSVVYPEARLLLPETQTIDTGRVMEWLRAATDKGWVEVRWYDYPDERMRAATDAELALIADEYRNGLRDPNEVRQILDRADVWLKVTEEGKRAVDTVWPDMPPHASY